MQIGESFAAAANSRCEATGGPLCQQVSIDVDFEVVQTKSVAGTHARLRERGIEVRRQALQADIR